MSEYYEDVRGGILEAFGKMFHNNLKVYLYPMKDFETGQIITSNNLKLHPRMKDFYKFFKYNGKIVDIFEYENDYLSIFSREILTKIRNGEKNWIDQLPSGVAEKIMNNDMFGWKSKEVKANN